jgi:hypothetical protein
MVVQSRGNESWHSRSEHEKAGGESSLVSTVMATRWVCAGVGVSARQLSAFKLFCGRRALVESAAQSARDGARCQ